MTRAGAISIAGGLLAGLVLAAPNGMVRSAEPVVAPAAGTPSTPEGEPRKTLLQLEQDWGNAVAKHDAAFLERFEADGYVYTDPSGAVSHKADDLANARAADCKIESFKLSDMKTQVHGDSAIVTGQTVVVGSDHGGSLTGTYRWTDVFVRGANGLWQVAASQATTISRPEDAAATTTAMPVESPAGSPAEPED